MAKGSTFSTLRLGYDNEMSTSLHVVAFTCVHLVTTRNGIYFPLNIPSHGLVITGISVYKFVRSPKAVNLAKTQIMPSFRMMLGRPNAICESYKVDVER